MSLLQMELNNEGFELFKEKIIQVNTLYIKPYIGSSYVPHKIQMLKEAKLVFLDIRKIHLHIYEIINFSRYHLIFQLCKM